MSADAIRDATEGSEVELTPALADLRRYPVWTNEQEAAWRRATVDALARLRRALVLAGEAAARRERPGRWSSRDLRGRCV